MKTNLLFTAFFLFAALTITGQTFQNNVGVPNQHYHDLNQEPLNDGSDDLIVASNLFDSTMSTSKISLKRVDQLGNVVWAKTYNEAPLSRGRSFDIVTYFDLIYLTGSVDVAGTKRTFIARIDAMTGNPLDVKYYNITSAPFNALSLIHI